MIKNFIREVLLIGFSLYLVGSVYPGLIVPQNLDGLLVTAVVFTLVNLLVKPVIKLFLLPLNLLTLGFFRWVTNVLVLVIITKIAPELKVVGFVSSPVNASGFAVPALNISLTMSYILASLLLSLAFSLLQNFLTQD